VTLIIQQWKHLLSGLEQEKSWKVELFLAINLVDTSVFYHSFDFPEENGIIPELLP